MSETGRVCFSATYKAKVAQPAIRGRSSTAELAQQYRVHSNQVSQWKRTGLASAACRLREPEPAAAGSSRHKKRRDQESRVGRVRKEFRAQRSVDRLEAGIKHRILYTPRDSLLFRRQN